MPPLHVMLLSLQSLCHVIGASLSEPHTSVTALQDACTCMSGSKSVHKVIYRKFKLNERIRFCTHAKGLQKWFMFKLFMFSEKLTRWMPHYLIQRWWMYLMNLLSVRDKLRLEWEETTIARLQCRGQRDQERRSEQTEVRQARLDARQPRTQSSGTAR